VSVKFSEDVIPLTDLKINPGKVVNHAKDTHRPVLLTSRGRGVAVVQALDEYEKNEEERAFLRAVAKGMMDVKEGKEMPLSEVMEKLGIE
jgi:prevent-host-death family protein